MRLGPSNMGRCGNGRGVHFGGVTMHPLTMLHPPGPPKHGQFDRHVGYSPPTVRNFLQHCLYIIWGMLCPLACLRFFLRNCLLCPLTCYTAG